ncbi:MAG TPA: family 43 glycosylhydrolase, partial [Acidimicrobiales bacterium]
AGHNAAATTDHNNDQCIGRAWASTPMGPYAPEATPLYCGLPPEGAIAGQPASNRFGRGALDPDVFRAYDGHYYLVMALSRTKGNIGSIRLAADGGGVGLNATPSILATQSLNWHDGSDDSGFDASKAFLENPTMIYEPHTKTYLLFYSAGQWYTSRYNTGFARCAHATGPCTLDTRGPFLKSGNGRDGVGGLTVFTAVDGNLMAAYASWQVGHENTSGDVGQYSRQTHWAKLVVSGDSDPSTQSISLR